MNYKVWVIKNSGKGSEEVFSDAMESLNYAKQSSLRALCCFRSSGKDLMVFENGNVAGPSRSKSLMKHVEEIFDQENEYYAKEGRGKPSRKKQ